MSQRFKLTPATLSIGLSILSFVFVALGIVGIFALQGNLKKSQDDRSQAAEFRAETLAPQPSPYLENGSIKLCSVDTDCPAETTCYQPPGSICPPGVFCIQSLPRKRCAYTPTQTTTTVCSTNADCGPGNECYQPPMPPCPQDMACAQVMPPKQCRPIGSPQPTVKPTPTPFCAPRPACLDQRPPCNIQSFAPWCETSPTPFPSKRPTPSSTPRPTTSPRPTPSSTPRPTPSSTPQPTPIIDPIFHSVNWKTNYVELIADDFYIFADNKFYFASAADLAVHSDPGYPTYTTLELTWTENNKEMRLFMYFNVDAVTNKWFVTEARTYGALDQGNWLYYDGAPFGLNNLGQTFQSNQLMLTSTNGQGKLYFRNLKLKPTFKTATTTPSPSSSPYKLGDLNYDSKVDLQDYTLFRQLFLQSVDYNSPADLHRDLKIDLKDYTLFIKLIEL